MKALPVLAPINVAAIDEPDPNAGGASHRYAIQFGGPKDVLVIQFQHGPRGEKDSIAGVFDDALLAIIEDRLESFQQGMFPSDHNHAALTAIKSARQMLGQRVAERMARGVLGANQK